MKKTVRYISFRPLVYQSIAYTQLMHICNMICGNIICAIIEHYTTNIIPCVIIKHTTEAALRAREDLKISNLFIILVYFIVTLS